MSKKVKILIAVGIFILFIIGAVIAYNVLTSNNSITSPNNISETETTKQKAPDITVTDAEGNAVKLSDFYGKPIVLNFWASWCPPCKEEMPTFNTVYEEVGDDVQFMMVDLTDGQRETKDKGLAYIEEQGYTFPVYFDTEFEGAYGYSINSVPTTLFIDKEGYIVTAVKGAINENTLREGIDLINK